MNPYDVIVLLVLLLGVWRGWRSGIIRQAGGLLGVVLGCLLASSSGDILARWAGVEGWGQEAIYVSIVLVVILGMLVLTYMLDKAFTGLGLGIPVRVLGVCFAVGKYLIVMSLLVGLWSWGEKYIDKQARQAPTRFEQSHSYVAFRIINSFLFPEFK